MKRILTIFFCILLFTFFTIVKTDSYTITDNSIIRKLVGSNTVKFDNNIAKELNEEEKEKEVLEDEQKEIDAGSSNDVQTSTTDDYVQEDNSVTEYNYEKFGTYGRLYVYGFSAALYDYNVNTNSSSSLQTIVDDYDSAAYYRNRGKLVIADHDYQGFSVLTYLPEGTYAYIKFEDGSSIGYTLIRKSKGYNTGPDLVDTEGNSFFNMDSDLIMYTCYDGGIMVTLWSLS